MKETESMRALKTWRIVIGLLGILFIMIAVLIGNVPYLSSLSQSVFIRDLAVNLGASCLAVVLLSYPQAFFLTDIRLKRQEEIADIFPSRRDAPSLELWIEEAPPALRRDVLGLGMERFTEFLQSSRGQQLLKKGVKFRILLVDPARADLCDQRDRDRYLNPGTLLNQSQQSINILSNLIKSYPKLLQARVYQTLPYCGIVRIGNEMMVTDYLYGIENEDCPTLHLVQSKGAHGLFQAYSNHFEKLWSASIPIQQLSL